MLSFTSARRPFGDDYTVRQKMDLSREVLKKNPFFSPCLPVGVMPRIARAILTGYRHHVTQRGNRRQPVFEDDALSPALSPWGDVGAPLYESPAEGLSAASEALSQKKWHGETPMQLQDSSHDMSK